MPSSFPFSLILFSSPAWSATPAGTVISERRHGNLHHCRRSACCGSFRSGHRSPPRCRGRRRSLEFLLYAPGRARRSAGVRGERLRTARPAPLQVPSRRLPPPSAYDRRRRQRAHRYQQLRCPLVPATQYHLGEPVFLRLTDGDQNWDPAAVETVVVVTFTTPRRAIPRSSA